MSELFQALTSAVEQATLLAIPAAFLWGVLSLVLSPCHLASVPLVIGYINRGEPTTARRALWTASWFALGTLITIAAAGAVALAAGQLLGQTNVWTNILVAVVFVAVGLYLLGLLPLPTGAFSPSVHPRRDALGALLLGLVAGLALGPCTFAYLAPILAVIFNMSGTSGALGAFMLLAFAIGHGTVIVLLGAFAGALSKVLAWNERSRAANVLRKICGVLLLAGAGYLIYRATQL